MKKIVLAAMMLLNCQVWALGTAPPDGSITQCSLTTLSSSASECSQQTSKSTCNGYKQKISGDTFDGCTWASAGVPPTSQCMTNSEASEGPTGNLTEINETYSCMPCKEYTGSDAQSYCKDDPKCTWQTSTSVCVFHCSNYSSSTSCGNNNECTWSTSTNACVVSCSDYTSSTSCNSNTQCTWSTSVTPNTCVAASS